VTQAKDKEIQLAKDEKDQFKKEFYSNYKLLKQYACNLEDSKKNLKKV
jgi:hypothetical protein